MCGDVATTLIENLEFLVATRAGVVGFNGGIYRTSSPAVLEIILVTCV